MYQQKTTEKFNKTLKTIVNYLLVLLLYNNCWQSFCVFTETARSDLRYANLRDMRINMHAITDSFS